MLKRNLSLFAHAALLSLVLSQPACAAEKKAAPEETIRAALKQQFPRHTIGEVRKSPLAGIWEVTVGSEVVYSDARGKYVFFGDLVDLPEKRSLTEERKNELMKTVFDQLPLDAAIKVVRGNGERKLAVFTDPDCPYCKQLDRVGLKDIDNVTLYYYLLPLDELHPDARRKSTNVWCAEDRAKAWYDLILNDRQAPDAKCDAPLQVAAQLAERLGFKGTPGLFFADGTRVPGAIDSKRIEQLLEATNNSKK